MFLSHVDCSNILAGLGHNNTPSECPQYHKAMTDQLLCALAVSPRLAHCAAVPHRLVHAIAIVLTFSLICHK